MKLGTSFQGRAGEADFLCRVTLRSQVNRIKLLIFIEHNSQAIDLWDDFWPRPNYFANPTYGDYGDWLNIVVNQVTR
jgi:hypothetical protein